MLVKGESIAELVNGDFDLLGLAWEEDGRDLRIEIRLPDRRLARLRCAWATDVVVDLRMDERMASVPSSWDATLLRAEGRVWIVRLDFAGNGEIRCECTGIELEIDEDDSVA